MRFLDIFAGIGGFRLGMEMAGHECVGYVEWDDFARRSYEAIHDTKGEWTWYDVSTIDYRDIPRAECWTFGFPCQDISIGGKQEGFRGNRSSQFFAVTKRLRQIKEWDSEKLPSFLFIENVKNFLSVNNGWDFLTAQIELDEIGYNLEWDVLNSRNFSVPQNRERVFIIGHLRGRSTRKVFPLENSNRSIGKDIKILAHRDGYRRNTQVYDIDGSVEAIDTAQGGGRGPHVLVVGNVNPSGNGVNGKVYDSKGLSPTLTTNKGEGPKVMIKEATKKGYKVAELGDSINLSVIGSKTRRGRVGKGVANTLDTSCNQGVLTRDSDIRKLTPLECFRLQGFPDWAYDRAAAVNSDSQLYKQAGNSVTVNVIYEIAKRLETQE
ncbi:DNA cytosine methyltransferase [Cytobacillus horneckiae]|uniref:DNA cytosine methyltransferase n=1 Tax=Cytobacillus horneckiae TaxID=549687 RepID=UPI003D9A7AFD